MTKEDRNKITKDQVINFFLSYYPSWRLNQILTNEKLINEKFTFYSQIINDIKQFDDLDGEATIAQEITNGLYFETISYCVQYIEDLFALLNAGKNKSLFIKNIITYKAGNIEKLINTNFKEHDICNLFHFPILQDECNANYITYKESISRLHEWIKEMREFHIQHLYFYNQYKHGLTIALRPYKIYDNEQIQKSKDGNDEPYLVAFDSQELEKIKDKKERFNGLVLIPNITENVSENIKQLMSEDNLIRYVFPPRETDIKIIKKLAFKVRVCINLFRNNLIESLNNDNNENIIKVHLPTSEIGHINQFIFINPTNKL